MSENKIATLAQVLTSVQNTLVNQSKVTIYRFDIFKGAVDAEGKVTKVKSLGAAYLRDGLRTYTVNLKTFLNEKFYLLPNTKPERTADFVILTREASQNLGRKYFWNNVGEGHILEGANHGLMQLRWDLLPNDIFMTLHPINSTEVSDVARGSEAA